MGPFWDLIEEAAAAAAGTIASGEAGEDPADGSPVDAVNEPVVIGWCAALGLLPNTFDEMFCPSERCFAG